MGKADLWFSDFVAFGFFLVGCLDMLSSSLRGLAAGQRQLTSKSKSLSSIFATADQSRSAHTVEEASFSIQPFKLHLLESGPAEEVTLTREDALNYYKSMVVVRRMESVAANLYKEKAIRGFCHLCAGQEAVCVGMKAGMRRRHSHHLLQGSWFFLCDGGVGAGCP